MHDLKGQKKAYFLEIWKISIKSIIKKLFGGTVGRFSGFFFLKQRLFLSKQLLDQAFNLVCHFLPVLAGKIS